MIFLKNYFVKRIQKCLMFFLMNFLKVCKQVIFEISSAHFIVLLKSNMFKKLKRIADKNSSLLKKILF